LRRIRFTIGLSVARELSNRFSCCRLLEDCPSLNTSSVPRRINPAQSPRKIGIIADTNDNLLHGFCSGRLQAGDVWLNAKRRPKGRRYKGSAKTEAEAIRRVLRRRAVRTNNVSDVAFSARETR